MSSTGRLLSSLRGKARDAVARRMHVPRIDASLELLARNGFQPPLVYDVGAYRGDFAREARRVWPSCRVVCFEPLPARVRDLQALVATDAAIDVVPTLLGASTQASVPFHEGETASSVLAEHHAPASFEKSERPMRTLDEVAEERGDRPRFLKLDVQGYELEVLRGAERTLATVEVILAEVNLLDIHVGVPLLAELIGWLDARGFVAFDVAGLTRRPLDGALWQMDFVFAKRDSALRKDKRWGKSG